MSEEDSNNNTIKEKKSATEWRRDTVLKMLAGGYTQSEIARELKLHRSTISLDVQYVNEQCKEELRSFIEDKLPMQIKQAFISYDEIIKDAERIARTTVDEKTKIQANHLRKETVESRIELATNADIATKVMDMAARAGQKNSMLTEEEEEKLEEDKTTSGIF